MGKTEFTTFGSSNGHFHCLQKDVTYFQLKLSILLENLTPQLNSWGSDCHYLKISVVETPTPVFKWNFWVSQRIEDM